MLTQNMYSKLSKARMKVWGIKARWIKACVVSNKRSEVQTAYMWLHAWTYLNIYSIVGIVSRSQYRVVIKVVFTSQHN